MSTDTASNVLAEVEYPDSDGKPMAENTLQFRWIVTIQGGLDALFRDNPNVFVAGDLFWYPVEGDNKIRHAPDALVVIGRPKGDRGSYMQWREEGIAPQVVFEVLSPGNHPKEMDEKRDWYFDFGVEEYYQFDPDRVRLRVWVREGGVISEVVPSSGWVSPRLGIRFELGDDLVIFRPDGQPFATYLELDQQKNEFKDQAEQGRLRAEQADQRAEQERLRAEQADQRAEQERLRAEQERQIAGQERLRADRLAARLRELGLEPDE